MHNNFRLRSQPDTVSSVWAPLAKDVALVIGDAEVPLVRGSDGWWRPENPPAFGDHDYAFRVDGDVLPDPRSPFQPYGVHGRSRQVDHTDFRWTDARWQAAPLSSAIIYELHIGTFTPEGTFDKAIERLDHLVELGATHVELMPVAQFLGNHGWGYDGVCPFAPHSAFGGPAGLKRLVDACHARGLAILLDVVYNHLGPSGNYLGRFAPYFSDRHHTPWGAAINFDGPDSHHVRRYFCDNALMWLRDYHFDGLRLDAIHAIVDASATPFLEQLVREVTDLEAQLGRHFVLIAESDLNDPRVVRPVEAGGYGFDAQWCDDIHHALHTNLTGERSGYYADFGSLADLATVLQQPFLYVGQHSTSRNRPHGSPPTGLSGHRFLAYTQTHDQIGNRAKGERLVHLAGVDAAKIAAALVILSPYVPMLFQGEEWAASSPFQFFVDFSSEPDLAAAVVKGRMIEFAAFGWDRQDLPDPTSAEAFHRSKLDWSELTASPHKDMLPWYRALIELRRSHPALASGRLDAVQTAFDEGQRWLRVERGPVTIACNLGDEPRSIPLSPGQPGQIWLSSKAILDSPSGHCTLPAWSVAVLGPPRERFAARGSQQAVNPAISLRDKGASIARSYEDALR